MCQIKFWTFKEVVIFIMFSGDEKRNTVKGVFIFWGGHNKVPHTRWLKW